LELLKNYRTFVPMRVITKKRLKVFWEKHKDCEQSLLAWYKVAKAAKWSNFSEVKDQFNGCKIIGNDRIVFKIKGNDYRLVVKITFANQIIWIRFIGTHKEYDKINCKTI